MTDLTPTEIRHRPYAGETDFWLIRKFLVDTYPISPLGLNWEVRRWDGVMFYRRAPGIPEDIAGKIQIWHRRDGEVLGVVHPEGAGEVHLFVHPGFRELEQEMLAWAEAHLAASERDGANRLVTFAYEYDQERIPMLLSRDYKRSEYRGSIRRLNLEEWESSAQDLPGGFSIATTHPGDLGLSGAIADLLNAAFQRDFHIPEEHATFSQFAPSYLELSDLLAVSDGGVIAAYVGVAYDDINQLGIFEPVCTHPDFRRNHLARALMLEGLRRLQAHGAREVVVSTGGMEPANRLYDSLGFSESETGWFWVKKFPQF